jgi:hypothetical protein
MALTTESAGRVRQKTRVYTQSPAILMALKAVFLYLATTKKNPDLAFLPITGSDADAATGQVLSDSPCIVYAVYGRKPEGADTDAYLNLFDDATDDAGAATDTRVSIDFQSGGDEAFLIFPQGLDMATGLVAKAYTDYDGTTDSVAGDAPNGFVIVSAA